MVSPTAKTLTFNASFSSFAPSSMKVKLIFLDNDAGSPIRLGSSGPKYTITLAGTDYAFPSGTSVAGQPAINIPGGGNPVLSQTFTVTIPANVSPVEDFVGGQQPAEAVKFTLQCLKNNNDEAGLNSVQSGPTITLTIPKLVSIITASPQTINFGNFTTATQTLQVGVKSTSSINVAVTSRDQMVLAGAVQPYPTNSVIPYTMTLNGDTIANGTSLTNRPRASVGGSNWPLVLNLTGGVPSGKLAGSYSDTITLTLTPGT
jgi:spore coat protein U-like protein